MVINEFFVLQYKGLPFLATIFLQLGSVKDGALTVGGTIGLHYL